jgi:hypothetical protein
MVAPAVARAVRVTWAQLLVALGIVQALAGAQAVVMGVRQVVGL